MLLCDPLQRSNGSARSAEPVVDPLQVAQGGGDFSWSSEVLVEQFRRNDSLHRWDAYVAWRSRRMSRKGGFLAQFLLQIGGDLLPVEAAILDEDFARPHAGDNH